MELFGSQQSEQNHSGNSKYLGKGDHMTIEEQMKKEIERQQNRI